jgi:hypothetical protein
VIGTVNVTSLEEVLNRLKGLSGVKDAVLVSRSGMHVAGKVPDGAHQETFVAMSAILLGAAETASSELRDECREIILQLQGSKMLIHSTGPKALLVMRGDTGLDYSQHIDVIRSATKELAQLL